MRSLHITALRFIRKLNNITVYSLAEKLNINSKSVTNYESGTFITSKKVVEKLKVLFPYVPEEYFNMREITRLQELELYGLHYTYYYDKISYKNYELEKIKAYDLYKLDLDKNKILLGDIKQLLESHTKYATLFELFLSLLKSWNLNLLRYELQKLDKDSRRISFKKNN